MSGLCFAAVPGLAAVTNSFAAPADFDCDRRADISRKQHNGIWVLDLSATYGFGGDDLVYGGYGDATTVPVPADYDGDCRADLSVKGEDGVWSIDYAVDGFGRWDAVYPGYGPGTSIAVPADYDGDGRAAWVDVLPGGGVTNNSLVWTKFVFEPVTTTSIRVRVRGALQNYSRIVEVEAWQ
jgi:hypothetical protein